MVARIRKNKVLDDRDQRTEYMIKIIHKDDVNAYLKHHTDTSKMIDRWVECVPRTPHIVQAWEVFEDYQNCFYLMEYWPNAPNVFQYIKRFGINFFQSAITPKLCKFVFQYVI